jgi:hypothetical protein
VESFARHFHELNRVDQGEIYGLQQQIERAKGRIKNVTVSLASMGFSEALTAQLKEEEGTLAALKGRLAAASGDKRPKVLPHPQVVESYIVRVLEVLDTNAEEARVVLAKHMPPLVLSREGNAWRLAGGFDLSLMLDDEGRAAAGQTGPGDGSTISRVGGTGIEPATRAV